MLTLISAYYRCLCWTEPGVCYDESGLCRQYAKEGRCTSAAVHQYANYCKHSCGLCGELTHQQL